MLRSGGNLKTSIGGVEGRFSDKSVEAKAGRRGEGGVSKLGDTRSALGLLWSAAATGLDPAPFKGEAKKPLMNISVCGVYLGEVGPPRRQGVCGTN